MITDRLNGILHNRLVKLRDRVATDNISSRLSSFDRPLHKPLNDREERAVIETLQTIKHKNNENRPESGATATEQDIS